MADIEVFNSLGSLDGLVQVIYHSVSCFVLISEVGVVSWDIELGLVEESGQWWKGSWSKEDVIDHAERPTTERAVEHLADKLANLIVSGELSIKGWSNSHSEELQLLIGSDLGITLRRLPEDENSTRAMELLKKIALQAQLHGCHLFQGSSTGAISTKDSGQTSLPAEVIVEKEHELEEAQKRIKDLEGQVSVVKQMIISERDTRQPIVPKPPRGASRANPTRQKRKITEAEFESD